MIPRPHLHFDHLDESTLAISRSDRRRNCAYERKKKKKKRKGKNHGTRTIQRILPCPFCLIAAEKLDGAHSLFVHGKERVHQRETGCYPFLLFSTSLQITRRTFAQRFACPRGRPHLIRMNGLARLTYSSNPPRFTRFRAKPSVFVTADQKIK